MWKKYCLFIKKFTLYGYTINILNLRFLNIKTEDFQKSCALFKDNQDSVMQNCLDCITTSENLTCG